jgi:hypothetical protein
VTTEEYHDFVVQNGLSERILLELNRKNFNEVRWEESWDCATRIRNLFLKMRFSRNLHDQLKEAVEIHFTGKSVAVRSLALDEDTVGASFAGLHESYLNVTGTESILEHILLVWSSLWSDAALPHHLKNETPLKDQQITAGYALSRKAEQFFDTPQEFQAKLDLFVEQYGDLSCAVTGGTQCATNVTPLPALIRTGDQITVDGFLGIVTISRPGSRKIKNHLQIGFYPYLLNMASCKTRFE